LGVTTAAPEIFGAEDGTTQAVVANPDGSFNSPSNPAPRGSEVAFWATGQGPVDSSTPYAKPQLPVTATIGGVDAKVVFTGLIYNGVLQVNLQIPPNAPTGAAVDIVLTVGSASSRRTVTLAVQ
jgi:uncharacterized protein (TIGR03437 family)